MPLPFSFPSCEGEQGHFSIYKVGSPDLFRLVGQGPGITKVALGEAWNPPHQGTASPQEIGG